MTIIHVFSADENCSVADQNYDRLYTFSPLKTDFDNVCCYVFSRFCTGFVQDAAVPYIGLICGPALRVLNLLLRVDVAF